MATSCRNFLCPMGLTYLLCLCKILDTNKIKIGINFVMSGQVPFVFCPKTPHENGEHLQISRNCRYCLCNSSLKHYYDGLAWACCFYIPHKIKLLRSKQSVYFSIFNVALQETSLYFWSNRKGFPRPTIELTPQPSHVWTQSVPLSLAKDS